MPNTDHEASVVGREPNVSKGFGKQLTHDATVKGIFYFHAILMRLLESVQSSFVVLQSDI
jgi:hypothetical protein